MAKVSDNITVTIPKSVWEQIKTQVESPEEETKENPYEDLRNYSKSNLVDLLRTDVPKWNNLVSRLPIASEWCPPLDNVDLSGANLTNVNLRKASLQSANLSKTNLRLANLSLADLTDAFLDDANLEAADFGGANLTEASLVGADLGYLNLEGATVSEATISKEQAVMVCQALGFNIYNP